ncbi:hypothetical protein NKH77_40010 [Streptomyces sp. M19]
MLERTTACVRVERSVLGTVEVIGDEVRAEPLEVHLYDSVLDATGHGRAALSAPDCRHAHAVLYAHRSTVIGEVHTHAVRIAENALFTGRLHVARRGVGRMRFCYVPPGSRTPRGTAASRTWWAPRRRAGCGRCSRASGTGRPGTRGWRGPARRRSGGARRTAPSWGLPRPVRAAARGQSAGPARRVRPGRYGRRDHPVT